MALGAASMTGAIASGIISVLTEKYQKKLKKVTKLIDIITPALVVFERVISGALKDGIIDEEEFNTLQTLHLETLDELMGVNRRMEAENRFILQKRYCLKMDCIDTYYNLEKNTMTSDAEQLIEYGQRLVID